MANIWLLRALFGTFWSYESQAILGPAHNLVLGPAGVGGILAKGSSSTSKIVHVTGHSFCQSLYFEPKLNMSKSCTIYILARFKKVTNFFDILQPVY